MKELGPIETHPFETYFPLGSTRLILGSMPPHRFTIGEGEKIKKENDVNFFYGSKDNLLWRLLGELFHKDLKYKEAIIDLLRKQKLGISDIVKRCQRKYDKKGNLTARDSDIVVIEYRDLNMVLTNPCLSEIICTSEYVLDSFKNNYSIPNSVKAYAIPSPSRLASRSISKQDKSPYPST